MTAFTTRQSKVGRERRQSSRHRGLANLTGQLYLLPAAAVFIVFIGYPLVQTVILSLSGTDILGR